MQYVRTLLFFVVAAIILAGACLVRATERLGGVQLAQLRAARLDAAGAPVDGAGATPFTREHLLGSLSRALASHFNLEGELQLELLRPWVPPARLASEWRIDVLEYPSLPSSSMMVRCRLVADAAPAGDVTFVFRASLWRDAWVARQPIAAETVFDPSVLEARRTDVLRERDVLPAAVGDRSFMFARSVAAGRPLTWRDVARRHCVKKGELVEVSAVDGNLAITMKAVAMENGARGDTVKIRNPESRKDFSAQVVDENRVQVRL